MTEQELHLTHPASISERGTYGASFRTRLSTESDARARGELMLNRQAAPAWTLSRLGLRLDLIGAGGELPAEDAAETAAILGLEMHDLVSVTGFPAGSPHTSALLWVEGWEETIEPGAWRLDYAVSDYCRNAVPPAWDDLSTETGPWGQGIVSWDTIDDALTWDAMYCQPPAPPAGRWSDVPSSLRWDQAGATAWDDWS